MKTRKNPLLPKMKQTLEQFGENIRLARLRRKFTMEMVAQRAGIGRTTLSKIEKGEDSVSIGSYFQVLFVLGLEKDLLNVAKDDVLGRKLQDAQLPVRRRAPKSATKKEKAK